MDTAAVGLTLTWAMYWHSKEHSLTLFSSFNQFISCIRRGHRELMKTPRDSSILFSDILFDLPTSQVKSLHSQLSSDVIKSNFFLYSLCVSLPHANLCVNIHLFTFYSCHSPSATETSLHARWLTRQLTRCIDHLIRWTCALQSFNCTEYWMNTPTMMSQINLIRVHNVGC